MSDSTFLKSQSNGRRRMLLAIYIVLGILITVVVSLLGVTAMIVDDWSRDLNTNYAETSPNHPNEHQRPMTISMDRDQFVDDLEICLSHKEGWEVESIRREAKRSILHATRTTKWLRFTDDIYVYVNDDEKGIVVSATSQSRIGKGDLGQNPRNLQELMRTITSPGICIERPPEFFEQHMAEEGS